MKNVPTDGAGIVLDVRDVYTLDLAILSLKYFAVQNLQFEARIGHGTCCQRTQVLYLTFSTINVRLLIGVSFPAVTEFHSYLTFSEPSPNPLKAVRKRDWLRIPHKIPSPGRLNPPSAHFLNASS
jgi:hypothetical protein